MKVFLCKGSFFGPVSGADQTIINYAVRLREAGHDPTVVIVCEYPPDDQYYTRLRDAEVPVVCLARAPQYRARLAVRQIALRAPNVRPLAAYRDWEALLYRTLVAFLKRERPDVVHVLVDGGTFIRAAHEAMVPVLYQEVATPWYGENAGTQEFYGKLSRALPLATELAALSPRLADLCREKLPCPESVSVLPIIVEEPPASPRAAANESGADVVFGFASRLERLKGPDVLLDAFARMLAEFPNCTLRLAGSGDDEAELRDRADRLGLGGRASFTGVYRTAEEKAAFVRGLDVLVQPSFAEGTPNSVIEAMACGVPVVASAVGGLPDLLPPSCGALVPPGDVAALARAMTDLAGDAAKRERLGRAARARYLELFAPSAVVPVLLETYARVAALGAAHAAVPSSSTVRSHAARAPIAAHPWS